MNLKRSSCLCLVLELKGCATSTPGRVFGKKIVSINTTYVLRHGFDDIVEINIQIRIRLRIAFLDYIEDFIGVGAGYDDAHLNCRGERNPCLRTAWFT